jgi:hypothetical protein
MRVIEFFQRAVLAVALVTLTGCGSDGGAAASPGGAQPPGAGAPEADGKKTDELVVQLGDDLAPAVQDRVRAHLAGRATLRFAPPQADLRDLSEGARVLALGETSAARALVSDAETTTLHAEGYVLRSGALGKATALAMRGSRATSKKLTTRGTGNLASAFGAYAALEELGFGFLHPLAPTLPAKVAALTSVERREEPRWPIRGLQLHTMHPLELTNLLQGWGRTPEDAAGWAAMLPEWDAFLEWLVANGQNRVHWVLLEADAWTAFATSETRHARLAQLVSRAHAFGITVGVDVPIALRQQNTFRLVHPTGDLSAELVELRGRVDWLMSAGFDYLATENGTTEFTHPDATRMLAWMNELAKHAAEAHGAAAYVKLHCSTGQTATGYNDPATGQPINFNYLPHFADPRLGVMPHTVQHYGLDDPAPTYGNTDFGYVREFLRREVGLREIVWHPETAYWVSFDIDVPLFLPLYAERRVHDLRLLGGDEEAGKMGVGVNAGKHMDGQQTFSSGWEWAYWLNDVVTARAAWDPKLGAANDEAAVAAILDRALRPFGAARIAVRDLVIETARAERELLIDGRVGGVAPTSTVRKNGQAYLQGFETWDDVSDLGSRIPGVSVAQMTQPARVGLVDMRSRFRVGPRYTGEIEPLLAEMEHRFAALLTKWSAVRPDVPASALDLYDDMVDAMHVTAMRARQVHGLYDYVDARDDVDATPRLARLASARSALDEAAAVVKQREPRYRVPAERIAGWGTNPTAYRFGYLWTARSLYYFWRDEGQAVDAPASPCYLNILSMTDVGLGEGAYGAPSALLRTVLDNPATGGDPAECAAAPASEPTFPQLGLRSRP